VVPVVDLSRRGRRFADEFAKVAHDIAVGGQFLLGSRLAAFEDDFAAAVDADRAAGVSSGAAALQLGLSAIGIGPGDEVLVPAFTAVPTASAVVALGATPVFVDVHPGTACLDVELVDRAITTRTRAIVVVHLYGRPAELPQTDLPIVQDAAQAHGAVSGATSGSFTAYSFYPTKNHGGIGDGGAVATNDEQLDERVRLLRVHGARQQYVHEVVAQNHRMSELEAAWLHLTLPSLADDNARRRAIASRYRAAAAHLRWQDDDPAHVQHLCVFRIADRKRATEALARAGVATAIHYPLSLPEQPAYRRWTTEPCPEAADWARTCVSVPCFPEMTDDEVEHVATALAGVDT
jgi:dTDP-4-amino-4,6-dideoxygalactose transaminase